MTGGIVLALGCAVQPRSRFARKNYFYPDLSKNYQTSQYDEPMNLRGELVIDLDGVAKTIGITRIHVEEDAAKNMHGVGGGTRWTALLMSGAANRRNSRTAMNIRP